jgi:stage II sporulation protein P
MKTIKKLFLLILISFVASLSPCPTAFAESDGFIIYNEYNEIVCERSSIEIGDTFITPEFYEYEIISIENHTAKAKLVKKITPPTIKKEENVRKRKMAKRGALTKKICLYLTHNDESYVPTDGYDSIYGAGGVHDVAKEFKSSLANKNIEVVLDETLHIPHNSSAYTRSSVTAENLLATERPDAMFDVHRDGVGKSYYYVNIDGQELSKIRIVVGKSNPNFEENYQFAQDVFALGNSMYPWLFADVYCGKGHYNQALQPTDLLFEMGTYMIEKEYVLASIPYLADVVDIALYGSEDDGNGNLIVEANQSENN